jgi:hypothetical protein
LLQGGQPGGNQSDHGLSRTVPILPGRAAWSIGRRAFVAGAASLVLERHALAEASAFPGAPTILVAGPPGGPIDHWAALIAEPLGKRLLQSAAVARENVGGPDGVTAANQFQARTPPDGATAMLMPGATAMSWLVGDPRVRFDAGRWAPLWGGEVSAIVASRSALVRGRPVRVAVQNIVGPELAALLALDLMGIPVVPIAVAPTNLMPFDQSDIDLVLLRGPTLKQDVPRLLARRWRLSFGLGMVDTDGQVARDPAFPQVPTAYELIEPSKTNQAADLLAALRSVAAAAALDLALVLPLLTPAAAVAWWRQGCSSLASVPDIQAEARRSLVRPIEAGLMAANVARITAEPSVLLALRRWLGERHHWHPG